MKKREGPPAGPSTSEDATPTLTPYSNAQPALLLPSATARAGFIRLSDLLAGKLPPLCWLAEPLLTVDALGVIGAPAKCFKSWILADLVVAVSSGEPWLGVFPIRRPHPVVLVSPEGGQRGLARRVEAILRFKGAQVCDLDVAFVRTRGLALTDRADIADLRAVARDIGPGLIAYDSIYAGLPGVRTSQLGEFGAALRELSVLGQEVEAAVVVTHHLNAREGTGLHRLTGAGPAEWASAAILGTPGSRLTVGGTTTATVHWALSARDVPELAFSTTFTIATDDPTDLAAPLDYKAHVAYSAPGGDAGDNDELGWVERRVLDALLMIPGAGADLQRINDVLARDSRGKPLRHQTLREVLDRLIDRALVDGLDGRWWATDPSRVDR